jgi:pimeloyl-ACP methyl ester carboxylesterase
MHRFFKSEFFNFEFLRILSTTRYGGCEIGEALEAAAQIKDGDPHSWSTQWSVLSTKAEELSKEAQRAGDTITAHSALLRASNYRRASQYMLNAPDPTEAALAVTRLEKSEALFKQALLLQEGVMVHELAIPYGKGIHLPAYLYVPTQFEKSNGIPLVINLSGGDSTQEEMFVVSACAGPPRGYAVLTFEGPGQGILLKRERLPMEPAYEKVTSTVLDFLEHNNSSDQANYGLDLNRIAVVGQSMGGYFALRAAADQRVKACIAVDPPYDMWDLALSRMPGWFMGGWVRGIITDSVFKWTVGLLSNLNYQLKWEVAHLQAMSGADNAADAFRFLKQLTLKNADGSEYLRNVKCPVLVTAPTNAMYFDLEVNSKKIFATLDHMEDGKREYWVPDTLYEGGLQAKVCAFELANYRIFGWCDKHL